MSLVSTMEVTAWQQTRAWNTCRENNFFTLIPANPSFFFFFNIAAVLLASPWKELIEIIQRKQAKPYLHPGNSEQIRTNYPKNKNKALLFSFLFLFWWMVELEDLSWVQHGPFALKRVLDLSFYEWQAGPFNTFIGQHVNMHLCVVQW